MDHKPARMAANTANRRTSRPRRWRNLTQANVEAIALAETLQRRRIDYRRKDGAPRGRTSEVTCDWNCTGLGRCGGSRASRLARCAPAVAGIWVLSRRKALAIST